MHELLTDAPEIRANDRVLAKNMADTLHKAYPNHLWAVSVDSHGGVASVRNMRLSGNWGFMLKLNDVYQDPGLKCVLRAGGEILERYRLSRRQFNQDHYGALETNCAGLFRPDL